MITHFDSSGIAHRAPKRHKIRRIASTTNAVLHPLIERFGEAYVKILLDWPSIVGPQFARSTKVSHLKFPGKLKTGGILTIQCASASIPLLQMQSLQLVDRINQYFGYNALAQIRFQAGLARAVRQKKQALQPLSEEKKAHINDLTSVIENPTLRDALERLGQGIYQMEENNRAQ